MDPIISLTFVVTGAIAIGLSWYVFIKTRKIKNWPKCQGLVYEIVTDNIELQNSGQSRKRPTFGLKYKYEISGKEYLGASSLKTSYNKKYKINDTIMVAYNPSNPQESDQYENYLGRVYLFLLVPGLILLFIGLKFTL